MASRGVRCERHTYNCSPWRSPRMADRLPRAEMTISLRWDGATEPSVVRIAKDVAGRAVDVSPDSQYLALGDEAGTVRLYDFVSRTETDRSVVHGSGRIDEVRFSPRGDLLATAGSDDLVRLWSFPDLTSLHTFTGHERQILNLRISRNDRLLASCSADHLVKLWDAKRGVLLHDFECRAVPYDVGFSPDGVYLAAGCRDGSLHLWQVNDGTLVATLEGHRDGIGSIAWSPDGKLLATGAMDDFVILWDMAHRAGPANSSKARISHDGRFFARWKDAGQ